MIRFLCEDSIKKLSVSVSVSVFVSVSPRKWLCPGFGILPAISSYLNLEIVEPQTSCAFLFYSRFLLFQICNEKHNFFQEVFMTYFSYFKVR